MERPDSKKPPKRANTIQGTLRRILKQSIDSSTKNERSSPNKNHNSSGTVSSPKKSVLQRTVTLKAMSPLLKHSTYKHVFNTDEEKKSIAIEEELDSLLALLEHERVEVRLLAYEVVQGLSRSENETIVLSSPAWKALAILCTNFDDEEVIREVTWTLSILASHEECHKHIVDNIEWSTLLRLANVDNPDVKSCVCTILGYLATNDEYSRTILKNFLDLLIFSAKLTKHTKVKASVAITLANLSLNEENAKQICDRALETLIYWIMDPQEQKQLLGAVNTITNIILIGDEKRNRSIILKNGLVPLLKLLNIDDDIYILRATVLALSNLANLHDQHTRMIKFGMIDQLLDLLTPDQDEGIQIGICLTLYNMALNPDIKLELISRGVTKSLIDLQSVITNRSAIDKIKKSLDLLSLNEEERSSSADESSNLTESGLRRSRSSSLSSSASGQSNSMYSQLTTSSSINTTSSSSIPIPSTRDRSSSFGYFGGSGGGGGGGGGLSTSPFKSSSLQSGNGIGGNSNGVVGGGGGGGYHDHDTSSTSGDDSYYPGPLADLVIILELNSELTSQVMSKNQLQRFIELAKMEPSKQVQLADQSNYDIIPILILLLFCNDESIKLAVLDVIALITDNHAVNQEKIVNSEAMKAIIEMLFNPPSNCPGHLSVKAIRALSSLSSNNKKVSKLLRESGTISKLVDLLSSDNSSTQKNAATAICSLCENDVDNQYFIYKLGGIEPIVNMIIPSNPDIIKAIACATLTSIIKGNSKTQSATQGYKQLYMNLMRFLESKDSDVLTHTCALIIELCRDSDKSQKLFLSLGAAEALVALLNSLNFSQGHLLFNCLGSIYILSKKDKKRRKQFIECGAIAALKQLSQKRIVASQTPHLQLQKALDQTLDILTKDMKSKS